MNPVFKKLHLLDKDPVLVLNAPEDYYSLLEELEIEVHDEVQDDYHYVQVFAEDLEEGDAVIKEVITSLEPGAYFWFCYPKGSSKNYDAALNEDNIVKIFELYDFVGVTKVSLDDDWQAIRLKSAEAEEDAFGMVDKGLKKFNGDND
ncbi:MAG: hypothetical protein PF517_00075 [Salinivirgaceae bacterium]|jgi:hypothetical protein|nr:hypothetical protein [Salinivirgaceae bacterium]